MTSAQLDLGIPAATPAEELAPGAVVLRQFANLYVRGIVLALGEITRVSPFRRMATIGGHVMSAAMTNCGTAGWVATPGGNGYAKLDPLSGKPWPAIPPMFRDLAGAAAGAGGYPTFEPDVCLINRYEPGARLGLHQDIDETDFAQPIVSVSLGLSANFQFGGLYRTDPVRKIRLRHGDVVVWGGASRKCFHGVMPLKGGWNEDFGGLRINLTFRKAL